MRRASNYLESFAVHIGWVLCFLWAASETFALPPVTKSKIDNIFASWNQTNTAGCAVGIFKRGQTIYAKGFGVANLENSAPITPETTFDIASVSKQFTATAIILLNQRGKLSFDDDIRKFIPELPLYNRTITLRHLIHHTSGLRDYDTLLSLHGTQDETVVNNRDALEMICRQKNLNFDPGKEHSYSNSGYLLMALIVERISGQTLRQFLAENIFVPLRMSHAQVHDQYAEIIPNRAISYSKDSSGTFHLDMSNWILTGDGAVYASIQDFAQWDRNFYEFKVGGPQWDKQMVVRGKLNDGTILDYGFGVKLDQFRGLDRVYHSGRWEGYRSTYIRFPKQELGIAILSNLDSFEPEAMTAKIAEVLLEGELSETTNVSRLAKPIQIAEQSLDDFIGRYETFSPRFTVKISKETDRLTMEVSGPPAFPIVPESTNQFATMDGKAWMQFDRGPNGRIATLTVFQGKDVFTHWKVMTENILGTAFDGNFVNHEIDARYSIEFRNGRVMAARGRDQAELFSLENEPDSFVGSEWWAEQIRFQRDERGSIKGFALTTGRLKNLGFRKE